MSGEWRRPDEWCRLKGVYVLDPDGWRDDKAPSWIEPISEAEFDKRLSISTQGPWDWATNQPPARPAAGDTRTDRERVRIDVEHAVHRAIQEASWACGVAMLDSDVAAFRDAVLALPELAALLDAAEKDGAP